MPLRVTESNFLAPRAPGTLRWASQQSGDSIGSCGQVPADHLTWRLLLAYRCLDLPKRTRETGRANPPVSFVPKGRKSSLWPQCSHGPRHNFGTFWSIRPNDKSAKNWNRTRPWQRGSEAATAFKLNGKSLGVLPRVSGPRCGPAASGNHSAGRPREVEGSRGDNSTLARLSPNRCLAGLWLLDCAPATLVRKLLN